MKPGRRRVLAMGGGLGAALLTPRLLRAEAAVEVIEMRGTSRGERVWFSPNGLAVAPGTTIRWVNRDNGNSHTATAYHPDIYGRLRRIPAAARPWDTGFLLPGESAEVVLEAPGIYDYYCIPHEMVRMVGRIVVGKPDAPGWKGAAPATGDIEPGALVALPPVGKVRAQGRVDWRGAKEDATEEVSQ